jgi:hypothetical protein
MAGCFLFTFSSKKGGVLFGRNENVQNKLRSPLLALFGKELLRYNVRIRIVTCLGGIKLTLSCLILDGCPQLRNLKSCVENVMYNFRYFHNKQSSFHFPRDETRNIHTVDCLLGQNGMILCATSPWNYK